MQRTYDDTMFIETFEREYTWLNGFLRNVARFGARQAIIDPITERSWTYCQFNQEANRLAHALRADGVGKNDVVMTTMLNCPEFAFSYVGPRKIGGILNMANFNLAPGEVALLIDHNRPKVLIYSAEVRDMVVQAVQQAEYPPVRVVMADNLKHVDVPEGHTSYEDYVRNQPDTNPEMDFVPHIYDEVVRFCTSGTTALPKSVPLNDINDVLSAHDVIMQYQMDSHDVTMNITPWFHRGGCHCGGICPTFYVGGSVVVARHFIPRQSLRWVAEYGVTFLIGAPVSLELLSRAQEKHPVDLSHLKGLVTMGSPFEQAACIRYLTMLSPRIFNGYGTTETLVNSLLLPSDLPEYAGSVGGSCIDDDVRVVNIYGDRKAEPDDMVPTDGETVGEVIIFAPGKSTYSYYNNPAEAEKKFYRGWMYTGDLATWSENRYVTINGRKDDMIVCAAENVYPAQIEEVLNQFDKVSESIVTCVPDSLRGEAIAAYVVPSDPSLTVEELHLLCQESPLLSAYKRPRYYRLVDSIPLTATGKKMHYVIKQQAAEDYAAGRLIRAR